MTRPCKVGVQLPEVERFVPWPEYLDLARRAEAAGFDSVWVGDHLLYDLPDGSTRGPYEAWTTLAAIAAVTERVEIGPLVASTSFHAPAMLAKQAATVDAISAGPAHRGARGGLEPAGVRRVRLRLRPAGLALRGGAGDHRAAAARGADDVPRPVLRRRRLRARPAPGARGRPADHARLEQPADAGHRAAGRGLLERLVEHLRQLGRAVRARSRPRSTRRCREGRQRRGDGRRPGHPAGRAAAG